MHVLRVLERALRAEYDDLADVRYDTARAAAGGAAPAAAAAGSAVLVSAGTRAADAVDATLSELVNDAGVGGA